MSCVVLARTIVGCCVVILIPLLRVVSGFMDRQFQGRPDVYLLTVRAVHFLCCKQPHTCGGVNAFWKAPDLVHAAIQEH